MVRSNSVALNLRSGPITPNCLSMQTQGFGSDSCSEIKYFDPDLYKCPSIINIKQLIEESLS